MSFPILFHRRKLEAQGKIPETYQYSLTETFKNRFISLLDEYCSKTIPNVSKREDFYIVKALRKIFGVQKLSSPSKITFLYFNELEYFILTAHDDYILSSVEYICRFKKDKKLINDVNDCFRYDRIGYKFIQQGEGYIVPIEDDNFYTECTNSCLSILAVSGFKSSQDYLISAYQNLSQNDYDDAIVDVGRAIETLLKERFSKLGIPYDDKKDSLNKLLNIAKQHIITPYSFEPFQQALLEVGRARNQMGAHGVTPGQTLVADELHVRFAINQAAANLLFLAEVPMSNK
ncbi:hypothetical protein [Desulfovibrio piger]|uniref:hypothetical protein n=1 Tax=Desulfovibrio piger TaxID=901 RepID=UPI0026EF3E3C|nr:hypothetical protein [Desulfovibrio piger]